MLSPMAPRRAVPLLLCLAAAGARADSTPVTTQVVVTASLTPQPAAEVLAPVTVLEREDIERSQARSLDELLRGLPGIQTDNAGGLGKVTDLFLRGTNSDHVVVLVDGVKLGSATLGTVALEDLPVEQIERIEIVRGPRSSLYGSEAIGGVIQIFTRRGGGPLQPWFSAGAGSYATSRVGAGVSGGGDRAWFNVSLSDLETGGFAPCRASLSYGCFTAQPLTDDRGYRNHSVSLRAGYRISDDTEVDAHVLDAQGKKQYDSFLSNETLFERQAVGVSLHTTPLAPWRLTLEAGQSHDNDDDLLNGVFVDRFNTTRNSSRVQNDLTLASGHLVTVAADWAWDRIDNTAGFPVTTRDDRGLLAQYQGRFGPQHLQLSARHDSNTQFGGTDTSTAAWGLDLPRDLRLQASYGSAFKAPTFNDLYYPGFGNPLLRPERSRSTEVGLSGTPGWGSWNVNGYRTRIRDLIAFDATTNVPQNVDEALIRGLEASVAVTLPQDWRAAGHLNLLVPEDVAPGPNDGHLLPRRARQFGRVDLDHSAGAFSYGVGLSAQGTRYDDLGQTLRMGGYALVDLRAEYRFTRDWRLQAHVSNLFDRNYEQAAYFNQPGTEVFISVRYQPSRP